MKIIEVRHTQKFAGHWTAYEQQGVEPSFSEKRQAISYFSQRFGGSKGEVHVYDAGTAIAETIKIDGCGKYSSTSK